MESYILQTKIRLPREWKEMTGSLPVNISSTETPRLLPRCAHAPFNLWHIFRNNGAVLKANASQRIASCIGVMFVWNWYQLNGSVVSHSDVWFQRSISNFGFSFINPVSLAPCDKHLAHAALPPPPPKKNKKWEPAPSLEAPCLYRGVSVCVISGQRIVLASLSH